MKTLAVTALVVLCTLSGLAGTTAKKPFRSFVGELDCWSKTSVTKQIQFSLRFHQNAKGSALVEILEDFENDRARLLPGNIKKDFMKGYEAHVFFEGLFVNTQAFGFREASAGHGLKRNQGVLVLSKRVWKNLKLYKSDFFSEKPIPESYTVFLLWNDDLGVLSRDRYICQKMQSKNFIKLSMN